MSEPSTDELYQAPLAEFVRVRDAVAARLKAAGDRDGAAEVKKARKPSLPAWAANQVVWHAPAQWERLQAAADALRRGHESGASPDEIRQASREQREALAACESRAAGFLVAQGHAATPAVVQKASGTLQALAYGAPGAVPGRVEEELTPPGFEVLAGLSRAAPERGAFGAAGPRAPAAVSSFADAARRREEQKAREEERTRRHAAIAAAGEALAAGRRALVEARRKADAHEARLVALGREMEAERIVGDGARRALAGAEADAAAAEAALDALRAEAETEG